MKRVAVGMRLAVIVACTLAAGTGSARAQLFDHLKCHTVHDPLRLAGRVDLQALQPQFSASGCRLGRASLFCGPVSKTLLRPPAAHPEIAGQSLSDDYVCYRLKCPTRPGDEDVSDQLGTRRLTKFRSSLLCVPARKEPRKTPCGPDLSCDSTHEVCVQRGPVGPAVLYSCEPVPAACEIDRTCACVSPTLCLAPFVACHDVGPNSIFCECPACQ